MGRPPVNIGPCNVPGCESPAWCQQMCRKHYNRVWRRGDPHAGEFKYEFELRIDKTGPCWLWIGGRFDSGYGKVLRGAKKLRAHRVSYELYVAPIPEGMHVLHKCDNPPCVNPNHLFLGTHIDNMRDMERKGRAKWIQGNLRSAL